MHKPDGCTFPNCFTCQLSDCEYTEEMICRDKHAAEMRRRRATKPNQYREAQRRRRALMEQRDPGHYARLERGYRERRRVAKSQ